MTPIPIMINGMPGNMAVNIASHAMCDRRFKVIRYSLTGPEIETTEYDLNGTSIQLISPDSRADTISRDDTISRILQENGSFIGIDYTHPLAANDNAAFYCKHGIPFIMGTTGSDREKMTEAVTNASIPAVIAPNMAKQIVGFQAMMEWAAETFPGLFKGYSLEITESHQKGKADTSGTAKAMAQYFNQLGVPNSEEQIRMIRDPDIQKNHLGVPVNYLSGHGWHTYTLISDNETVRFDFTHNINGRDIYVEGTLDAVLFLYKKIVAGISGQVFSMIDVLKE